MKTINSVLRIFFCIEYSTQVLFTSTIKYCTYIFQIILYIICTSIRKCDIRYAIKDSTRGQLAQLLYFPFAGHYMKFTITTLTTDTFSALLHSPVLQGSSKECYFRMWYYVLGSKPGAIRIYKLVSMSQL